ncbi:MAG: rRNA maturation RNase YbeY [Candidatus Babeliales bacterium]|jgi:rRNA maturation RNase YbeY
MIVIKNRQRKIKVDIKDLHAKTQKMLGVLNDKDVNYQDFDLGIMLTTNKTIRKFNKQFRDKDKPTDILSFPFHDYLKPGQKIIIKSPEDKNLGDLIISLEFAQKNAKTTWNRQFNEHLIALIAHGIAHLIGYDHLTDKDFNSMLKVEHKLLKSVGIKY